MSCCDPDSEPADVLVERLRKAIKSWRCSECRASIGAGDCYRETKALYDGSWSRWQTCERCADRRDELTARRLCHPPLGFLYDLRDLIVRGEPFVYHEGHLRVGGGAARRVYRRQLGEMREWATMIGLLVRWRFEDAEVSR